MAAGPSSSCLPLLIHFSSLCSFSQLQQASVDPYDPLAALVDLRGSVAPSPADLQRQPINIQRHLDTPPNIDVKNVDPKNKKTIFFYINASERTSTSSATTKDRQRTRTRRDKQSTYMYVQRKAPGGRRHTGTHTGIDIQRQTERDRQRETGRETYTGIDRETHRHTR